MFKLMVTGRTVVELRVKILEFLNETSREQINPVDTSQDDLPNFDPVPMSAPAPFSAPPAMPAPHPAHYFDKTPPPPALSVAPPVPEAVTPRTTASGDVDSRGVPYDERIHAVTRGVNKDGSWRTRRGVEPSLVKRIESESQTTVAPRASGPAPQNVVAPQPGLPPSPPPPPAVALPPPPAPVAAPAPFLVIYAPPPVAPVVHPVAVAPPPVVASPASIAPQTNVHSLETFKANLVATLANLVRDGKLTQEYVNSLKSYFQVDQIWNVNDTQLSEMFEQFVSHGLIVRV